MSLSVVAEAVVAVPWNSYFKLTHTVSLNDMTHIKSCCFCNMTYNNLYTVAETISSTLVTIVWNCFWPWHSKMTSPFKAWIWGPWITTTPGISTKQLTAVELKQWLHFRKRPRPFLPKQKFSKVNLVYKWASELAHSFVTVKVLSNSLLQHLTMWPWQPQKPELDKQYRRLFNWCLSPLNDSSLHQQRTDRSKKINSHCE